MRPRRASTSGPRVASRRGAALALVSGLLLAACVDETHDLQVQALGPEAPGVPRGPLHRPGQPCLVCHGGSGPASHQFSVAGTAFAVESLTTPLPTAVVTLGDAHDASVSLGSNQAGNFFV